jgi:hypothetical protein
MEGGRDEGMDGWRDGWMDGWMEGGMEGGMVRRTCSSPLTIDMPLPRDSPTGFIIHRFMPALPPRSLAFATAASLLPSMPPSLSSSWEEEEGRCTFNSSV